MSGISRYEKVVLLLTAGFLLFCGGWFLARQEQAQPYEVTVSQVSEPETVVSEAQEQDETPDSLLEGERIDLNTADVYDLQRLPGIGEKRARDIAAYREENGPFAAAEEIMLVSGIGEGTFVGLKDYVTVSSDGE